MPRSFSRSMESSTCPTAFLASMVPVRERSRSASVDLPWSMWATIEKLRVSAVLILASISREARVLPHHVVGLDHDAGPDAGARADTRPRGDDAVVEDGAVPDRHAIPEDRAGHPGAAPDDAPLAQHRPRADVALGVEPAPGADDARAGDLGRRLEGDIVGDPAPVGSRAEREPGGQLAGHEVELGLAVLGGAADVEPVVPADPSVEGDAVGEEAGKELPLDRHHPSLGDAAEELSLEQVDARVDRVRRHLSGIRFLDEAE